MIIFELFAQMCHLLISSPQSEETIYFYQIIQLLQKLSIHTGTDPFAVIAAEIRPRQVVIKVRISYRYYSIYQLAA